VVQADKARLKGDDVDLAFHYYADPIVGMPVQMNQKQVERTLDSPALENQGREVTDGLFTLGELQAPGSIANQHAPTGASHSASRQAPEFLAHV
jgi:hypothetical protein